MNTRRFERIQDSNRTDLVVFGAAGIVIIFVAAFEGWILHAYSNQNIGPDRAIVLSTVGSGLATVALVMVIFIQNYLQYEQIQSNEKQSLILQEAEWMPQVVFNYDRGQFIFRKNPPYKPELRLELNGQPSNWITPNIPDPDTGSESEWIIGIHGIFEDEFDLENDVYEGTLSLRFESITGENYLHNYDVTAEMEDPRLTYLSVVDVNREMPWDDLE